MVHPPWASTGLCKLLLTLIELPHGEAWPPFHMYYALNLHNTLYGRDLG